MTKRTSNEQCLKDDQKLIVLLDVHAIIHRAYHALPDFTSSRGESTGALYGLCTMLLKTLNDLQPDHMAACFDLPEPTYRHHAYEDYKAGRAEADQALVEQLKRADDIFEAFGIPIYKASGFEADDLLGTVVEQKKNNPSISFIIASGDMDTLQLADDKRVQIYTLKKGIKETVLYDEEAVKERFGFGPQLLPDFKGLSGDPSDNIIGIKGIGEKTATQLIQAAGSLENILKQAEKEPEKLQQAGIKERVIGLLNDGKEDAMFSKMLATIRRDAPIEFKVPPESWQPDTEKMERVFSELEFRSLIPRLQEFKELKQPETGNIFENEAVEEPDPEEFAETAVAAWLLDSTRTDPGRDDILAVAGESSFSSARDNIMERLKKEGMSDLFNGIEKPLITVVRQMNERGVVIDQNKLEQLKKEYSKQLADIETLIHQEAGREFNINSPQQLNLILFEELGLSAAGIKKTPTGARSTQESELEKLRGKHSIIEHILTHREFSKLLHTYLEPIARMIDDDGRLRARFIQTGTTTGRMSSVDPNLQNIPTKTEEGREIRTVFRATDGCELVAFDYSQIELRVAALLSGDERLLEIFRSQGDIHTGVASYVFDVSPEEVDKEMRRQAKVINFGILYGMGVNSLKKNLQTSTEEAQKFLHTYFHRFSGLAEYLERVKGQAAREGYTVTLFGRRRYFSGFNSSRSYIRASAERMAINAPIQGTAADIIKKAMVETEKELIGQVSNDEARLLLQVHDELIYEIKQDRVSELVPLIKDKMENILPAEVAGVVDLPVEAEKGINWKDLEPISNK